MKIRKLVIISLIAAIYTLLSLFLAPISFGSIQFRIAESLNMLVLIMPISSYGVVLGCFLTNIIGAMQGLNAIGMIDSIVGTLATAIACYLAYKFKNIKFKNWPILSMSMIVLINGLIIGLELAILLMQNNLIYGWLIFGFQVSAGEVLSVILGYLLISKLEKTILMEKYKSYYGK